jgi:serine/threonine-protein kinase PknG
LIFIVFAVFMVGMAHPTLMLCSQPNCSGAIDDGYCDVCGMAQAPSPGSQSSTNHPLSVGLMSQRSGTQSKTAPRTQGTRPTTGTGSSPTGRSGGTRRTSTGTIARSSRRQLGLGLVSIPELPSTQPEQSILADPRVPDSKRICGRCDNSLRRDRGFCNQCGQKYSFVPSLQPGELVAGQYEVKGAMAYGGLGWIYLGYDRTLNRYVVLKGLLNSEDAASAAVAVAERQFLASVKHGNIVGIYNFVNQGSEGFIVMEYVGGKTLKELRKERGPLPVTEAIAYIHRILGAFTYLHQQGLVYCDFKPDNIMLEGEDVKLIDLGGVRRLDDPDGDIYGTVGYTAPEAGDGPTVPTDLFTIGRTLTVMVTNIPGFSKENLYKLPSPQEAPLFAQEESLYRFLLKATAEHPDDRFQSAEEMADQLLGVLREIVARQKGEPQNTTSQFFGGDALSLITLNPLEPLVAGIEQLPNPTILPTDPAFSELLKYLGIRDLSQRLQGLDKLLERYPDSRATQFKIIETLQDMQVTAVTHAPMKRASNLLDNLQMSDPWDWRVPWYRGRSQFLQKDFAAAQAAFDQVYFDLPGELAPKLAFALAAEANGQTDIAQQLYDIVSATDNSYPTAAFGLARCLAKKGDRTPAIKALERIPATSNLHPRARVEITRTLIDTQHSFPGTIELKAASSNVKAITLDVMDRHLLSKQVLETALAMLNDRKIAPDSQVNVLDQPLQEVNLRLGLEKVLREMAHLSSGDEKIRLVDEANRMRPKTLF